MLAQQQETKLQVDILVEAPIDHAFTTFTEGIGTWFPAEYNLLRVPMAERVFEPRAGGRVYDRGVDGSECHWARVLVYDRPRRVVMSWDISPRWQIETDLANTSEVEVRFEPEGPNRTRLKLEHRHLDRHGEGWEEQRKQLGGEGGWPGVLRRYAERVAA